MAPPAAAAGCRDRCRRGPHSQRAASLPDAASRSNLIAILGGRLEESGRSLVHILESTALARSEDDDRNVLEAGGGASPREQRDPPQRLQGVPIVLTLPPRFEMILATVLSPQTLPELQSKIIAGLDESQRRPVEAAAGSVVAVRSAIADGRDGRSPSPQFPDDRAWLDAIAAGRIAPGSRPDGEADAAGEPRRSGSASSHWRHSGRRTRIARR